MADKEQEQQRGRMDVSSHDKEQSNTSGRRVIPGVNFEELNFEERRAPYKGGSRNRTERDYGASRGEKRSDPKPDNR